MLQVFVGPEVELGGLRKVSQGFSIAESPMVHVVRKFHAILAKLFLEQGIKNNGCCARVLELFYLAHVFGQR